jgi:hypothetical protein
MITPQPAGTAETELISLTGYSLGDLRLDQSRALAEAVQIVLHQVERPRANMGGSGPPGRAD